MLRFRTDAYYQESKRIVFAESSRIWTQHKRSVAWLNEVAAVPLQQSIRNLQIAFSGFFGRKTGYPKFKSKHDKQTATYVGSAFKWNPKTRNLKLAKQKQPLKIRWSRQFRGEPSTVTVSRDTAGRYFISFLVDEDNKPKRKRKNKIGVDLGLKDFVVTSDNLKTGHPRFLKRKQKRIALLQRRLNKKQKGSKNRAKAKLMLARAHAKVGDSRLDFLHKLSTKLINENQVICVETLEVKRMMKDSRLSAAIADSGWSEFIRQLDYKASWYGRTLVKIDKYYPSSKRCSNCGWVKKNLRLSERVWKCRECNEIHDRDLNAAKNILAAGLAVIACGDNVRLTSDKAVSGHRRNKNSKPLKA
jgi:putative transposase